MSLLLTRVTGFCTAGLTGLTGLARCVSLEADFLTLKLDGTFVQVGCILGLIAGTVEFVDLCFTSLTDGLRFDVVFDVDILR